MSEIPIKRVRFFDGQFLKQAEFREEQLYHLHMRRRLNYILFQQSGVVLVNGDELTIQTNPAQPANKNFTVTAGMAISKDPGNMEGKEIILRENHTSNLHTDHGIGAGETAYVTIHYKEEDSNIPPSEGDVDEPTRVLENAVIKAHNVFPPVPPAGLGAGDIPEYILLGTITYDNMQADNSAKHKATLNHHLGGAAPVILDSIQIDYPTISIEVDESRQLTAKANYSDGSDRDLGPADGLTWESSDIAKVTVLDGLVTGIAETTVPVTITATALEQTTTSTVHVLAEAPTLESIAILPASPSPLEGETITFRAMGTFSSEPSLRELTNGAHGLVWSSSSNININSVTGVATADTEGPATVTATVGLISETITFTVSLAVPAPVFDTTNEFHPNFGSPVPVEEITLFGFNFGVDLPDDLPTVTLIPQGVEIDPIDVVPTSVNDTVSPQRIIFEIPDIPGRTSPVNMLIQVRTSSPVPAVSTDIFRWNPPL